MWTPRLLPGLLWAGALAEVPSTFAGAARTTQARRKYLWVFTLARWRLELQLYKATFTQVPGYLGTWAKILVVIATCSPMTLAIPLGKGTRPGVVM